MLCKIADLLIEVPEAGGMAPRCQAYLTNETGSADIIIRADRYKMDRHPYQNENMAASLAVLSVHLQAQMKEEKK